MIRAGVAGMMRSWRILRLWGAASGTAWGQRVRMLARAARASKGLLRCAASSDDGTIVVAANVHHVHLYCARVLLNF